RRGVRKEPCEGNQQEPRSWNEQGSTRRVRRREFLEIDRTNVFPVCVLHAGDPLPPVLLEQEEWDLVRRLRGVPTLLPVLEHGRLLREERILDHPGLVQHAPLLLARAVPLHFHAEAEGRWRMLTRGCDVARLVDELLPRAGCGRAREGLRIVV